MSYRAASGEVYVSFRGKSKPIRYLNQVVYAQKLQLLFFCVSWPRMKSDSLPRKLPVTILSGILAAGKTTLFPFSHWNMKILGE